MTDILIATAEMLGVALLIWSAYAAWAVWEITNRDDYPKDVTKHEE